MKQFQRMFKTVVVDDSEQKFDIEQPYLESLYDVIAKNFKLIQRATFIHRLIYIGEHSPGEQDEVAETFKEIIDKVNKEYHLETLSGFLLVYDKCFVHMVEGDEDSINKHLKLLLENKKYMEHLGTMKLLTCIHHINQRFQNEWTSYCGIPSKLFDHIDVNTNLEDTGRLVYICVKKMYKLVSSYITGDSELPSEGDLAHCESATDESSLKSLQSVQALHSSRVRGSFMGTTSFSTLHTRSIIGRSSVSLPIDPYRKNLPEYELVKFLIKSQYTRTIQSYYKTYRAVDQRNIYEDRVWPIAEDGVPKDVLSKQYDAIVELPRVRAADDFHRQSSALTDLESHKYWKFDEED